MNAAFAPDSCRGSNRQREASIRSQREPVVSPAGAGTEYRRPPKGLAITRARVIWRPFGAAESKYGRNDRSSEREYSLRDLCLPARDRARRCRSQARWVFRGIGCAISGRTPESRDVSGVWSGERRRAWICAATCFQSAQCRCTGDSAYMTKTRRGYSFAVKSSRRTWDKPVCQEAGSIAWSQRVPARGASPTPPALR